MKSSGWRVGVVLAVAAGLLAVPSGPSARATVDPRVVNLGVAALDVTPLADGSVFFNSFAFVDGGFTRTAKVWSPSTGVVDLGVPYEGMVTVLEDGGAAFAVPEWVQQVDLNGDGDTADQVAHVWRRDLGLVSLGLAVQYIGSPLADGRLVLYVSEVQQGGHDFNGDGDTLDTVPFLGHPGSSFTSLGTSGSVRALDGARLLIGTFEEQEGRDLNGDGDLSDLVPQIWNDATGLLTLGVGVSNYEPLPDGGVVLSVRESEAGPADLNGDGDTSDNVYEVWNPETGLVNTGLPGVVFAVLDDGSIGLGVFELGTDRNGDGDGQDVVAAVRAPDGTVTNLGLAMVHDDLFQGGARLLVGVPESAINSASGQDHGDLNGDGDTSDLVVHTWAPDEGVTNLRINASSAVTVDPSTVLFTIYEVNEGRDLNDDGDTVDGVLFSWGPSSGLRNEHIAVRFLMPIGSGLVSFAVGEATGVPVDLNDDGDTLDAVQFVWSRDSGPVSLGIATSGFGRANHGRLAFGVPETDEGRDLNGDGLVNTYVAHLFDPDAEAPADPTPPVVTPHVEGTLGDNGWYTSDVMVSFTVTDPESQVTVGPGCMTATVSVDVRIMWFMCSATSAGGSSRASVTVNRDATAPYIFGRVTPAFPDGVEGWYRTPPTVSFACHDATSGVATCSSPSTLSSAPTAQTVLGSVNDLAGNGASAEFGPLYVDSVPPTVFCPSDQRFTIRETADVVAEVRDADSGPAVVAVSSEADTSSVGARQTAIVGQDIAGNTSGRECEYLVEYKFGGFGPRRPGSSIYAGFPLPVAFSLQDADGIPIDDAEATALSDACAVTARLDDGTPVCARYSAFADRFEATVPVPVSTSRGTHMVLASTIVDGVEVGSGSAGVFVAPGFFGSLWALFGGGTA